MSERLAAGYEPRFDLDREVGEQGELFVGDVARSINRGLTEVKYDQAASKYGNVYIEFSCRLRGEYVPSGVDTTEADLWAVVLGRDEPKIMVVAPSRLVLAVKERAVREGRVKNTLRGSHPTSGAVVPVGEFLRWLLDEADSLEEAAA